MRKKYTVIFDFDGVLVESESHSFALVTDILKKRHDIAVPDTFLAKKIGKPTITFLQEFFSDQLSEAELAAVHQEYKEISLSNVLDHITPHTQVLEFIKNNHEHYTFAIGSMNSAPFIATVLDEYQITPHISLVVTREEIKNDKPDPEIYLTILEKLSIQPADAVIIEDSPNGIFSANAANIDCIKIMNTHNHHFDFSGTTTIGTVSAANFSNEIVSFI